MFLTVAGCATGWKIIRGPLAGSVTSSAMSPATAPGLTERPRTFPQKSARAAGSAQSKFRAAKPRLRAGAVAFIVDSFRWRRPSQPTDSTVAGPLVGGSTAAVGLDPPLRGGHILGECLPH